MPKLPKGVVENWILMATGAFQLTDVARELGIDSPESKAVLRVYLNDFVKDGKLQRVKNRDGVFRPIDNSLKEIDLNNVDLSKKIPLKLPFEIQQYVEFYPKNTILVAGESNAGKTCFLYNVANLNYENLVVDFFTNNEASPQEIVKRLTPFGLPIPPPFHIYERYDNFADVIHPDHLSIIDYLDLNSEVYLAGEEIERLQQKTNCIVIIGMQLPPPAVTFERGQKKLHHRNLAYGGAFTQKKPVLYLDLWHNGIPNSGICRIEKAKNRAIPSIDPNNMQWKYTIDEWGAKYKKWEQHTDSDNQPQYEDKDF
jgi:hypothetical protein